MVPRHKSLLLTWVVSKLHQNTSIGCSCYNPVSFLTLSICLMVKLSTPSEEEKLCVRNRDDWQKRFRDLIDNSDCAPLGRLVSIVAYYEACKSPISNT